MFLQITSRNAVFSARCVIRTNRRAELPWCSSVCSSVCSSETGVHCDHTVHVSADLSLRLDIVQCFGHFDTNACPPTASRLFLVPRTWKRGGVWMCKLGVILISQQLRVKLLLSANRKSYMLQFIRLVWRLCTWTSSQTWIHIFEDLYLEVLDDGNLHLQLEDLDCDLLFVPEYLTSVSKGPKMIFWCHYTYTPMIKFNNTFCLLIISDRNFGPLSPVAYIPASAAL